MNSSILPEFELFRDFIAVQVICNFHKDPIKTKQASSGQGQICFFFGTKGQVTPKSIVRSGRNSNVRDFMPVQIICKFHKVSIKTKQAMLRTRPNMGFFGTKGQVNPKSTVRSGRHSNSSEISCLSRLSASLIKIRLKLNRLCAEQSQIWCFTALKGK